jgi:hypothetical protein
MGNVLCLVSHDTYHSKWQVKLTTLQPGRLEFVKLGYITPLLPFPASFLHNKASHFF